MPSADFVLWYEEDAVFCGPSTATAFGLAIPNLPKRINTNIPEVSTKLKPIIMLCSNDIKLFESSPKKR